MPLSVFHTEARSILSPVSGFLRDAGFTHSLSPARNCGYGCSYCYVPTMGIYGGLKPEDVRRWGQQTTFKTNAAALLRRQLRAGQVIYCSPLVDPYQPAEEEERSMPGILEAALEHPPAVFVIQTRGPLVLRDLPLLQRLSRVTRLRVSFSLTTNREEIRRRYEVHCAPIWQRLATMRALRDCGIQVHAALAPILRCDPEELADLVMAATDGYAVGDPLHVRGEKPRGGTTRTPALRIAAIYEEEEWLSPAFQHETISRIEARMRAAGRRFAIGPAGFGLLTAP